MSLKEQLVAGQLAESETLERATAVLASLERQQLESAVALAEAAGLEDIPAEDDLPTVEERAAALRNLARTLLADGFEAWHAEYLGHEWDADPPADLVGVGADSDTWGQQIEDWAKGIRRQHPDIEATDRELASVATRNLYGADLEEVEQRLADVDRAEQVNHIITGNFATAKRLMDRATASLQEENEEETEA